MPFPLTTGCLLSCSMGDAPMPFMATPLPGKPIIDGMVAGTITDIVPFLNIPSFVLCKSPANPMVIALIAATFGAEDQAPCIPVVVDPWVPPSVSTTADGVPLATVESMCMCAWLGEIAVEVPVPGPMEIV